MSYNTCNALHILMHNSFLSLLRRSEYPELIVSICLNQAHATHNTQQYFEFLIFQSVSYTMRYHFKCKYSLRESIIAPLVKVIVAHALAQISYTVMPQIACATSTWMLLCAFGLRGLNCLLMTASFERCGNISSCMGCPVKGSYEDGTHCHQCFLFQN